MAVPFLVVSRSTWACELKFAETCQASIESRHAPRERVSWNKEPEKPDCYPKGVTLHVSVWVEMQKLVIERIKTRCHAPRERVSWNIIKVYKQNKKKGHAPRERVSWNIVDGCRVTTEDVTLHVSVWVEIFNASSTTIEGVSRSTWACELKLDSVLLSFSLNRHAPRERVSWNNSEFPTTITIWVTLHVSVWVEIWIFLRWNQFIASRSTWACELKSFLSV